MYQNGLRVEQDNTKALHWFRKAADQGEVIALGNLNFLQRSRLSLASN